MNPTLQPQVMSPQTTPQTAPLDPTVVALAQAIRQQESGGNFNAKGASGESGGYQWMPATWKGHAKDVLGDANAEMTPANQNAVAYSIIKGWKDQGLNPAQIAAKWNSGSENGWENKIGTNSKGVAYNVPKYVKNVTDIYQEKKQLLLGMDGSTGSIIPVANAQVSGSTPATPEKPSVSGFVRNVASSTGNLVGGLAEAVMHPVNTVENVLGMAAGGVEKAFGVQDNEDTQKFDQLVGYLKNRYGGDSISEVMGHIGKTAYEDPVGMALDLSTVIDGVGAGIGAVGKTAKIAELSKAAELLKQASEIVNPITAGAKVVKPIVKAGVGATRSVASHLFSLSDPASITKVLDDPAMFSKLSMEGMNRASLAEEFGSALDNLHDAVKEGGRAYGGISAAEGIVKVPENWLKDVLTKGTSVAEEGGKAIPFRLGLEEDITTGKLAVKADTKSFTRDPRDIAAIQTFVDNWGNKTELTHQELLNMRSDLAKMSKHGREIGKNDAAELVARALRADANKTMRPQVSGLKEIDEVQAPIIQKYGQAKKDFLTVAPGGGYEFKPGAINKIANATGKGKDILLQRMEQISPGITKRIQILKAVEDWESASKAKVGSYTRGAIEGVGIATLSPHAIVAAIITNPTFALPILRGLGWSAQKLKPVINMLKKIAGTENLKYAAEAGKVTNETQK